MFDFHKLIVYQKAKLFAHSMSLLIRENSFDRTTNSQLRRASFNIMLNIAESTSRFSKKDRKNFLVVARGSAFECVAILEYLCEEKSLDPIKFKKYCSLLEEISKMLYSLIYKLSKDT